MRHEGSKRRGLLRFVAVVALVVIGAAIAAALLAEDEFSGDSRGAEIERFDLSSKLLDQSLSQTIVRPAGGSEGRPLLIFLHGRGGDPDSSLSDELFAALHGLGDRAPAIAFVNGGDHSYYHDRDDGPWGRYVVDEALPAALRRTGADPRRVAIGGISMGGFGALDLARQHPNRFCAVGGHSPALWQAAGDTPDGAFDDADDFASHDVMAVAAGPDALGSKPIWLDGGDEDPFRSSTDTTAATLRSSGHNVRIHHWPGGHDSDYWNARMPAYLRFYAGALARCHH
jgi:S-formylglutathione hydrolase FrmB